MIDNTKAKKAFKEYVKNYDIENPKIKLKIAHIERTSEVARKMAESLELQKEDIELAELIGLLHDIGRFEQVRKYNTFVDHLSENHAKIGIDILFKDGLIRRFIEDDKYDKIIELAIINHNKDKNMLPTNLSPKEELHVKLIRDSDKVDIIYLLTFDDQKTLWDSDNLNKEIFSDEIYNEFIKDHNIIYKNRKTNADKLISQFAFAFDFNFDYGLKYIDENKYYDKLYNRFNFEDEKTRKRFEEIYNLTEKYIKERLKEK